jgi:energy-coupling factor transport system permease protein
MLMVSASTACMLTGNIPHIAGILCVLILTLVVGGADMLVVLGRIRALLLLIAALFVIQTIFAGMDGLLLAAVLSLRLLVVVLAAAILLEGEIRDYLLALVQMKLPYELAFAVIVGLHFLPILRDEAVNIYCYMQLRGKDFKKLGIAKKLRAYSGLCLPILAGALRRAYETSIAMDLRGFRAMPGRTSMRRLSMRGTDVILTIFYPVIFIALGFIFVR